MCPLKAWFDDELMQRIAAESGLTCAFFVGADGHYRVRWFTPKTEIKGICGHGTVASAFVIINELGDKSDEITFHVAAGDLRVRRRNTDFVLDLPALKPMPVPPPKHLREALGREPEALIGALDLIAVFSAEEDVARFAPKQGEGEDTGIPGSAHCSLIPYWAERLGKTSLRARQLSPRGGTIECALNGDRVWLSFAAVEYMQGYLYL